MSKLTPISTSPVKLAKSRHSVLEKQHSSRTYIAVLNPRSHLIVSDVLVRGCLQQLIGAFLLLLNCGGALTRVVFEALPKLKEGLAPVQLLSNLFQQVIPSAKKSQHTWADHYRSPNAVIYYCICHDQGSCEHENNAGRTHFYLIQ